MFTEYRHKQKQDRQGDARSFWDLGENIMPVFYTVRSRYKTPGGPTMRNFA